MTDLQPLDLQLLRCLLHARDAVSVQQMADRLQASALQITRSLECLRQRGCQIEQVSAWGLQLACSGMGVWGDYLKQHAPFVEVYHQIGSTQDALRRLVRSVGAAADGAVTAADVQTAGRGRLGRTWIAPSGGCLLFSRAWVGPMAQTVATTNRLTFCTAMAVLRGIEQVVDRPIEINVKWPNDLLIGGKKLAGILVETTPLSGGFLGAMIGVGVNVSMMPEEMHAVAPEVAQGMTSLALWGQRVDRLRLLEAIVLQLKQALETRDMTPLLDQWRQRSRLLAHEVRLQHDGRVFDGHVVDLDPDQGLILRTDAGSLVHLPAQTTTLLSGMDPT